MDTPNPFEGFQPLADFAAQYLRHANGEPYTERSVEHLIRRGVVPVVKIGAVKLVDLVTLADRLRSKHGRKRTRLQD